MSRALISDNLADVAAWPHRLKFEPLLSSAGLIELYTAHAGLEPGAASLVSEWVGLKGNAARDTVVAGDPLYSASAGGAGIPGLVFTNPQILHSKIAPTAEGSWLWAARTPATMAAHQCIAGSHLNTTNRLAMLVDNTFHIYGQIGATDYTGTQILRHAPALSPSTNYVFGMTWDAAGLATLYLDGASVDTATWNGGGATTGTLSMSIGGRRDTTEDNTGNLKWQSAIMAGALYNTAKSGADMATLSAAMAALLAA